MRFCLILLKMPAFSLDLIGISWNFMGIYGGAAKTSEVSDGCHFICMLDVEGSMITFLYIYLNKN